jgi:serine/threonine protein kinase
VKHKLSGELFAVKIFNSILMKRKDAYSPQRKDTINDVRRETEILKRLNHNNIIKYKESIEDDFKTYIVLEYIEGSTLDQVRLN